MSFWELLGDLEIYRQENSVKIRLITVNRKKEIIKNVNKLLQIEFLFAIIQLLRYRQDFTSYSRE